MERIHLHWTAGGRWASAVDKKHYHFIVEQDGTVVPGNFPVEANARLVDGKYAAHTLNANTGAIGVALAGMMTAMETPFSAGPAPITEAQVEAAVQLTARLAKQYNIEITQATVLTHAEVQRTLGIQQKGKWDITWLPGMSKPGDPIAVGNQLRSRIKAAMSGEKTAATQPRRTAPPSQPEKEPVMNYVYVRVAIYFLAPILASLPGVSYNEELKQIMIDLETLLIGLGAAAIGAGGIFAKWGKK